MDTSSLYSWPAGLVNPSSLLGSQSSNSSNSSNFSGMFGLIGSGLNAIANIFNQNQINKANMAMQNKQLQFNHDEAALAYQRQRSLIAEQNEYNSFSNQRQLMEQAGYNPNSLVGGTAGTAVSSGSTSSSPATGSIGNPAVAAKLDLASVFAQLESLKSQKDLNDANAEKARADADAIRSNTPTNGKNLGDITYYKLSQDADLVNRNVKLFDQTFDDQVRYNRFLADLTTEQSRNIKASTFKLYNDIHLSKSEFKLLIHRFPYEIGKIVAETQVDIYKAAEALTSSYANECEALYKRSLATGQDIQNSYNRVVLSDRSFIDSVIDKAIYEASLMRFKSENEEDLIPYIGYDSESSTSSAGAFGVSGSSSSTFSSKNLRSYSRRFSSGNSQSSGSSDSPVYLPKSLDEWLSLVPKSSDELDYFIKYLDNHPKDLSKEVYFRRDQIKRKLKYSYTNRNRRRL